MFTLHSTPIATLAALGVLSILWGGVWAGPASKAGAAAALEVKVLEAQLQTGDEALYHMEVISVLHSAIRVKPGDTIRVRSRITRQDAQEPGLKPRGWIGTAYLDPDPRATGPDARFQFVGAANGNSFEELPPTPPSVRWFEYPRENSE